MSAFRKATAVGVVAWGLAVFPLAAQSSNTSEATAYLFFTESDAFMGVNDWAGVNPERAFLFLGTDGSSLNLGVGKNLGGLYLGAYYEGTFLKDGGNDGVQVSKTSVYDGTGSLWQSTTTTETYDSGKTYSDNSLAVLLGLGGNMGVKVSFDESLYSRSIPGGKAAGSGTITESADGTKVVSGIVSDYSYLAGVMTPRVDWGMKLKLAGFDLNPWAGVAFGINSDNESWTSESKTTVNGVQNGVASTTKSGIYRGSLDPSVNVGARLDKSLWGGSLSASLEYKLGLGLYSNPTSPDGDTAVGYTTYEETSQNGTVGAAKYDTISRTSTLEERSSMTHTIPLSASYTIDIGERLSLGAGVGVEFAISSSKIGQTEKTQYSKTTSTQLDSVSGLPSGNSTTETTTVTYTGYDYTYNTFGVTPELKTGAKVYIIPGKLRLNLGLTMNPFEYTSTTTTIGPTKIGSTTSKTVNGDGVVTETATVDSNAGMDTAYSRELWSENWESFGATLSGGLTFEMGGFTIDALATAPFAGGLKVNPWKFVDGQYSLVISYKF